MLLTYEAIDSDGRQTQDTVEAVDTRDAVERLRQRGLFVTQVAEASPSKAARPGAKRPPPGASAVARFPSRAPRLPLNVLVLFTRQMAMLLRAGSAVVPAVLAIKKQMRKPAQAAVLGSMVDDLEDGASLSDALRKHPGTFSAVYCAIVSAGEAAATLTQMFERLAKMVATQRVMRNKVLGSLAYPVLLVGMSCSILNALLFFVIPRFRDMFDQLGVVPPASTRFMLATADLISDYWVLVPIGLLSAIAGVVWLIATPAGRQWSANIQLNIPIVGRLRSRLIQTQVFRTIGLLLESGVGLLDTLELARRTTQNGRFQKMFDQLEEAVIAGGRLSDAFEESGIVEPYVCQAVHTGEESGGMGIALTYCADILDESNTELINTTMRLLEPLILIGMGIVVGTVAVSLFMPLFDLTAAI